MWSCIHYNDSKEDMGSGSKGRHPLRVTVLEKEWVRVGDICSWAKDTLDNLKAWLWVISLLLCYRDYHCWFFSGSQILNLHQVPGGFSFCRVASFTFMGMCPLPMSQLLVNCDRSLASWFSSGYCSRRRTGWLSLGSRLLDYLKLIPPTHPGSQL